MASFKSSSLVLVVVIMAIALQSPVSVSQNEHCLAGIGNLISCDPYVLPGPNRGAPSEQCCTALGGVSDSCYCTAVDIMSRLPVRCNLAPVNCA